MDDPIRISKPALSSIAESVSISESSSATIQEQKIQVGIADAKDTFEIKTSDQHFSLDAAEGHVRFGDGIEGKIPEAGDSCVQSRFHSGLGQSGNNPITDQGYVQIDRQNPNFFSGKSLTAGDLAREQEYIRDKRGLKSNTNSASTANQVDTDGAVDPNELVQDVLRESYIQTTEDLRFYAEKVKYFNEIKKGSS
jgi:hypothetical protein